MINLLKFVKLLLKLSRALIKEGPPIGNPLHVYIA